MRFSLIDLLVLTASFTAGALVADAFFPSSPMLLRLVTKALAGLIIYLAIVYPIYRGFRLFPLVLPRCPCCKKFQNGFHFDGAWPRITYCCPTCGGEFIIWHNGKPTKDETWDKPVLVLKWPYVTGRYTKMIKSEPWT